MKTTVTTIKEYDPAVHGRLDNLCAQTTKNVQMLPLTPEKITTQKRRSIALNVSGVAVGYCAQTATYPGDVVEIGSLIVDQNHRRHGIAKQLVNAVTEAVNLEGLTPIVFCNPISAGVFTGIGYEPMPVYDIPMSALELCSNCPKRPTNGGCCDTVYVYEGASNR